jgi:hypothetical protein
MLGSAKPSVVAPTLDPVDTQADHIVAVAHTGDTAGTVEDIVVAAGIAAVVHTEDTAAVEGIAHSLFAVLH